MSSPILPVEGQPSTDYTVITTPAVAPVLKGTAGQIVLARSVVRAAAFGRETVESYEIANGQDAIARAFMDDCLDQQTCIDAERRKQQGDNTIIDVTWAYDREDATWTPGNDQRLWDFEIQDTSQPLASHPYFGRHNALGSDLDKLMTQMGACDQSLALGKDYKITIDSPPSAVLAIMERYAGLRYFGVDEWNPITVMLSIRYRLYQSQTEGGNGNAVVTWPNLFHGINQVVDLSLLSPPAYITSALGSLQSWVFDSSGSTAPTLDATTFVWIRQKPLVKLSGRNPNGPSDVTEYLLGVQQASAILHPPVDSSLTPGWDPRKNITP